MSPSKILCALKQLCVAIVLGIPLLALADNSSLPQLIGSRAQRDSVSLKAEVPSPAYSRSGRITINVATFDTMKKQVEEARDGQFPRIQIQLFEDVSIIAEVRETAIDTKDPSIRSFQGWVVSPIPTKEGNGYSGRFGLSVQNGIVRGAIYVGNIIYEFQHVAPDGQIVRIFDTTKVRGGPPVIPGNVQKRDLLQAPQTPAPIAADAASPATIDVLVAFTTAAKNAVGEATIRQNINVSIGTANHAYIESTVNQRLRLVYAAETAYVESADLSLLQDLNALQSAATNGLKDMRRWRDQFAADLVSLWAATPSTVACGLGFQPVTLVDLNDTNGFSAMPQNCFGGDVQALAHELGHNMGLGHDLGAASPPPATMIYPYGHGYVGLAAAPPFRTIMAYTTVCTQNSVSCPLEFLFSNPSIIRNGIAAGIAASANESLALNNVSPTMSGYRGAGPIKDIKAGSLGSNPSQFASANGTLYFVADDGINGAELWKSDGTPTGTVLVKDMNLGNFSSPHTNFGEIGGKFFFLSENTLWRTDGTATGTVSINNFSESPQNLAISNGLMYFTLGGTAGSGYGDVLWKSDGSIPATTVAVKDITPFASDFSYLLSLTDVGNVLFFTANDGTGFSLWKSTGTTASTVKVKQTGAIPFPLTAVNGMLFFTTFEGANGGRLWKSDGTDAGTVVVKSFVTAPPNSGPDKMANVSGTLYFAVNDGVSGTELWKSDGTPSGTVLVKDIAPGPASSSPRNVVVHGTNIYFIADDGANGVRLWKSNGTAAGTMAVNVPGIPSSFASVNELTVVLDPLRGDQLFFAADNTTSGRELHAISLPTKNVMPLDFAFSPRTEVSFGSQQISTPFTVSGIDSPVPMSVEGGAFSIGCTVSYFIFPTTIDNGQTVCVRHTASSLPNGRTNTTLTIGGISAAFTTTTLGPKTLSVSKGGTGTGTVTSSPAGISCGNICNADFPSATVVSLAVNPDYGSAFGGWSGAGCAGTGGCSVTMDAAKAVVATFNISSTTVPNAPSSPSAAPGNASATFSFYAYSDGGAPITSFTVTCNTGAIIVSGPASPIRVTGLTNDVPCTCTITATNSVGTSAPSPTVIVVPSASAPLNLVAVKSRKTHGSAGIFDLPVSFFAAFDGAITVEPRAGPVHSLVFQFNDAPATVGGAMSLDPALMSVGSAIPTISGTEIVIDLIGIPDNRRVLVRLSAVNGTTNFEAPIGFLVGDVMNLRSVNAIYVSSLKLHSGQTTNSSNYKFDLNWSGYINAADISAFKARLGRVLP